MKEKNEIEVNKLKLNVEEANKIIETTDSKMVELDDKMNKLFALFPNLLDDRVPEGNSDADNPIVTSWGEEKRKMGAGYLWHDEIATKLNGLDVDAAARISGARFSVLKGSIARL
jgi:seryl-tRNA synthetase